MTDLPWWKAFALRCAEHHLRRPLDARLQQAFEAALRGELPASEIEAAGVGIELENAQALKTAQALLLIGRLEGRFYVTVAARRYNFARVKKLLDASVK